MSEIELLKKQIQRERAARKAAEGILEDKALELYEANQALILLNHDLESEVEKRSQSLAESEKKYRMLVEHAEDMIYNVDDQGRFTFMNAVCMEIMGYSQEEAMNKKFFDFLPMNFRPFARKHFDYFKNEKIKSDYHEFRAIKKSGEEIWVGQSIKRIDIETGQFYFNVVARDITERKKLEKQLVSARQEAEDAQEAEKLFLANMSHEIRTPLNAIIGMSHLLNDTILDKTQKDYIKTLLSSAGMLKSLISDVLDISKIDAGFIDLSPKPLNLHFLGSQLIHTQKMSSNQVKVAYEFHCSDALKLPVMVDERLLNQILVNLLGNASKFTHEGKVKLTVDLIHETDEKVEIEIKVTDTGIGISNESINQIFSKFKQANNEIHVKYGGTGLGLAISKKLVKLMGGDLRVESKLNKGSTFFFTLILDKAIDKGFTEVYKRKAGLIKQDIKVAVVEDNLMNQKYIASIFSKWKLDYTLYSNGKEALKELNTTVVDIILMDIEMPLMDGIETTLVLREGDGPNRNTPIIALTASSFLSKKNEALNAGMSDFLPKPFIPNELKSMMQNYVSVHNKEDEHSPSYKFNEALDHDYLHLAYGEDVDYALEMFMTFDEIIPDELKSLKSEVRADENSLVKARLHKIKPMFTMVGLGPYSKEIGELEALLSKDESLDLASWYDTFENSLNAKLPIIKEQISNLQSCLEH